MEKVNKCIHLVVSFLVIFFVYSCNKDSGSNPSITRNSLTGTWLVNETTKKTTYEVIIQVDSTNSTGVLISNFGGGGQNVKAKATLSGNLVSLGSDELLSNGWIVNGSGTVSNNSRLNWSYSIHDGANLTNYTAIFTKE